MNIAIVHLHRVCLVGKGVLTCRYITNNGSEWECQKGNPSRKALLDKKVADGAFTAQGDNCAGTPEAMTETLDS